MMVHVSAEVFTDGRDHKPSEYHLRWTLPPNGCSSIHMWIICIYIIKNFFAFIFVRAQYHNVWYVYFVATAYGVYFFIHFYWVKYFLLRQSLLMPDVSSHNTNCQLSVRNDAECQFIQRRLPVSQLPVAYDAECQWELYVRITNNDIVTLLLHLKYWLSYWKWRLTSDSV